MNKLRRKELTRIAAELEKLFDDLCAVVSEEEEAYENLPESLQESERGEAMSEAAGELDSIAAELDELRERIESMVEEY